MRSSAGGCRQKSGGMCSCVPTISFIPVGCRSHPRSSASIGGSTEVSRSPPCPPCLRGSKRPLGGHAGRLPALRLSSPPLSTQTKGSARLVNRRPVRPPTHRTRRSWPSPKNTAPPHSRVLYRVSTMYHEWRPKAKRVPNVLLQAQRPIPRHRNGPLLITEH